jgi:hypothetical protein
VHLVAHTPNATCLVLLRVIGSLARTVAQSFWLAVISARLSAARIVQVQSTVRFVVLTLSRIFEPTS